MRSYSIGAEKRDLFDPVIDSNAAIYQRAAALPCLTCPLPDCEHPSGRACERFQRGWREAKSPSYAKVGRKKSR